MQTVEIERAPSFGESMIEHKIRAGAPTKENARKVYVNIKEMIEGAVVAEGGLEYMRQQARDNPTAFLALVGKILPRTINLDAHVTTHVRETLVERAVCLLMGREPPALPEPTAVQQIIGNEMSKSDEY
jgi:hypothetical protein